MSINRITRERLFKDESIFNQLLPFAKFDEDTDLFIHSDASLWSVWELQPQLITKVSDAEAFHMCSQIQELLDSLDHTISAQFCWITTFDVDQLVFRSMNSYPLRGPAGWMARRWLRMLQHSSRAESLHRRPRNLRLVCAFRHDPSWTTKGLFAQIKRSLSVLFSGNVVVTTDQRRAEYIDYANKFRGIIEGKASKLADLGFKPRRINGQGLINLLYPLLNRRSTKSGKFRRGRNTTVPFPIYDPHDLLSNQISETSIEHPQNGIIRKD